MAQQIDVPAAAGATDTLPSLAKLDRMTYQVIAFGFPLLTLTIITGAVWAEYAWGTWWSWDPKETSSLVAWLIYAAYLHGRINRGWQGLPAAIFAGLGFLGILFCYVGVNFFSGLHSYGMPQVQSGGLMNMLSDLKPAELYPTQGFILANLLAMVSFIVFAISRAKAANAVGRIAGWAGFLLLTVAIVVRTVHAGRLPLTSGYDFTLCFIWGISLAFLVYDLRQRVGMLGSVVYLIILGLTMYAYLFQMKASSFMPPALQNKFWLHVHVTIAILAYGALALSFGTAVMYVMKYIQRKKDEAPPAPVG